MTGECGYIPIETSYLIFFVLKTDPIEMSLTNSSANDVARSASVASLGIASLSADARNLALTALHAGLTKQKEKVLRANARDVADATQLAKHGELSQSVLKRLDLARPGKYEDMLQGILNVRDLEDPSKFCYLRMSRR